MNENINLVKILRKCPQGIELYSPLCGECHLMSVNDPDTGKYPIKVSAKDSVWTFSPDGKFTSTSAECLLFPARYQRDWKLFDQTLSKCFDPKSLEPLQPVIVWIDNIWTIDFFSFIEKDNKAVCSGGNRYDKVIPYDNFTKSLIGTDNPAPEYYHWWKYAGACQM